MKMAPVAITQPDQITISHNPKLSKLLDEAARIVEEDWIAEDDETDSVTSSSSSQRTTISFALSVKVHEVMSLGEFSDKELKRCWYNAEDKAKMNASKDKMVARLEKGKAPKPGFTYRGLECWTSAGGQALDENIARVIDAVMDEQDRQWNEGHDDWDRISELSQEQTADSVVRALEVARLDEEDARTAWDEPQTKQTEKTKLPQEATEESSNHSVSDTEDTPPVETLPVEDATEEKNTTKSKSKKGKKKKKKASRRSSLDPPAPVRRTKSQDATEIFMVRRMASRQGKTLKV